MSQEVTTGLFTLGGVVVGGGLNVATTVVLARLDRRRARKAVLRLIASELLELGGACDVAYDSIAEQDELPLGLVRGGHEWSIVQWEEGQALVAEALSDADWLVVARAYREVHHLHRLLLTLNTATLMPDETEKVKEAVRRLAAKALRSLSAAEQVIPLVVKFGKPRDSLPAG